MRSYQGNFEFDLTLFPSARQSVSDFSASDLPTI